MNPMAWMVAQQARTGYLPGRPEMALETVMHVCDQTWRTTEEIALRARRSKTHCGRLLREAASAGMLVCLPARGKWPAQFKLPA